MNDGAGAVVRSSLVARREIDAQLIAWLDQGSNQYFHLIGPPGSGKSTWLQGLVDKGEVRSETGTLLATIAACHSCHWDDAASSSGVGFLQKVSEQLAAHSPQFAEALVAEARRSRDINVSLVQNVWNSPGSQIAGPRIESIVVRSEKPNDILDSVLRAPLRATLGDEGPIWLLVVDAPDEPAATDVADLIQSLGSLPTRFRVLVATRPSSDLVEGLGRIGARSCALSTLEGTEESVVSFLRGQVAAAPLAARLNPDFGIEALVLSLASRAGANFLVARCALQALSEGEGPITAAFVADLPDALGGYYHLFLERLDRETRKRWAREAGPVVGALAVARAPLAEAGVAAISGISQSVVRDIVTQLRSFIEPAGERRWRIFHATFAEFLLNGDEAQEFWCPTSEQHDRIVRWVIGENRSGADWSTAPEYGVQHIVHHIIEAGGPHCVQQVDAVIDGEYLRRRFALGATVFDLSSEFRRILVAVRDAGAVRETLFFASLLTFWQDRIANEANPASTILLAAMGRVEEAVRIAANQHEAAHANASDTIRFQEEFAVGLVRIGEVEAAFDFSLQLEGEANRRVGWAAFNALAVVDPKTALDRRALGPFGGELHLRGDAFKALASEPEGLQLALDAATSGEERIQISEGCAKHDLDQALELVSEIYVSPYWLCGERFRFAHTDGMANVLAAFVAYHPERVRKAWRQACLSLDPHWPMPYGALLAGRFAELDQGLGLAAFARLAVRSSSLSHLLAATWVGALGGPALTAQLGAEFLGKRTGSLEDSEEFDAYRDVPRLGEALQLLALIAPHRIDRDSPAFAMLLTFWERLLVALDHAEEIPEKKARGARVMGTLAGWLGDEAMAALMRVGEKRWRSEGWQHEYGEGCAASLARRGASDYVAARSKINGYAWWEGAVQIASEIVAREDPGAMLQLIDSVEIRYSTTRARLVGTAAIGMKRAGIRSLAALPNRLSPYVDGAIFADFRHLLRAIENPPEDDARLHEAARAKRAVNGIIADPKGGAEDAVSRVESLPRAMGVPFEGETIWPDNLRRELSDALFSTEPISALRLIVPITYAEGFKLFAEMLQQQRPELADVDQLADWLLAAVQPPSSSWEGAYWQTSLVTGFALSLPSEIQLTFIAAITTERSSTYEHVKARLRAFADPEDALQRNGVDSEDGLPEHDQAFLDAVGILSARGDFSLFERVSRAYASKAPSQTLVGIIGSHWPADGWEASLAAFDAWIGERTDWDRNHLLLHFIESLLPRAALFDPKRAFGKVDELVATYGHSIDKPFLLRKMIGAVVGAEQPSAEVWPQLLAAAQRITENSALRYALENMLDATRRLAPNARAYPTCGTIAALALASREHVIQNLEKVYRSAIAADKTVIEALPSFAARLREIVAAGPGTLS